MNIYQKLQTVRVELQRLNIKKSGHNKFAGYDYYELGDIIPPINDLLEKHSLTSIVSFDETFAHLTIVNAENPEERVIFTSPMAGVTLKGAHDIQNLGAVETYQRRYLYMMAFEIVENDYFDATQGSDSGGKVTKMPKKPQQKPAPAPAPAPKTPAQKPAGKLSQATSDQLNGAIKQYSKLSGAPIAKVAKDIEQRIGKPLSEVEETDADAVLAVINEWTDQMIMMGVDNSGV